MHPGCNDLVSAVDGRRLIVEARRDRFRIDIRLELVKILYWVGSTLGKSTEGRASGHQQDRLQQNQQLAEHPVREKTTRRAPVIFPGVSHGEMHLCPPLLSNKKNDFTVT